MLPMTDQASFLRVVCQHFNTFVRNKFDSRAAAKALHSRQPGYQLGRRRDRRERDMYIEIIRWKHICRFAKEVVDIVHQGGFSDSRVRYGRMVHSGDVHGCGLWSG